MQNKTFNPERFWRYFIHDFLRCIKRTGLATLATCLIPVIMLIGAAICFTSIGMDGWSLDIEFTQFVCAVVSVLYLLFTPISCYGELTDRRKGSNFLMLPASHTEKFISMVLNSIVIFPAIFSLLYLGLDALCCIAFPSRFEEILFLGIMEDGSSSMPLFFLPAMVSAAGICGALLFKSRKASKTFLTCAVSFILLCLTMFTISYRCAGNAYGSEPVDGKAAWYIFQGFCTVCCLVYTYIKTKRIQL
ncbi:MAG: hypothetical protein NC115_02960 [Bacteroidales bacterium]|nr:hypothetical protein [Bacteroidales bacterium]